jgi:hypothetical protein
MGRGEAGRAAGRLAPWAPPLLLPVLLPLLLPLLLRPAAAAPEPAPAAAQQGGGGGGLLTLARVDLPRGGPSLAGLGLPLLAHFLDAAGSEYALTLAPAGEIAAALAPLGLAAAPLDARPAAEGGAPEYLVAHARPRPAGPLKRRGGARAPGAAAAAVSGLAVVLDDGARAVLRVPPGAGAAAAAALATRLGGAGFAVQPLAAAAPLDLAPRDTPFPPQTPAALLAAAAAAASPGGAAAAARAAGAARVSPAAAAAVRAAAAAVNATGLRLELGRLCGSARAPVGGARTRLARRQTDSGAPLRAATQYVFEQLASAGLEPAFFEWVADYGGGRAGPGGAYSGRNVVADRRGAANASQVVILMAHLDDMPHGWGWGWGWGWGGGWG